MKKFAAIALAATLVLGLAGCGSSGSAQTSDTATAENPLVLTLAHGLSESHTVHIAMTEFAEKVEERTDGRIKIEIYPNGQLGSENENMEQLMAGVISMTKVSAPGLATYNEAYHTFGLPYIFDDTEDFYHKMDSQEMRDFFLSSEDDGFVTITYYTSGARSFYTKDTPIRTPDDLKGLKIRIMENELQLAQWKAYGANPTPMAFTELFTALQQGTVDGQDNGAELTWQSKFQEVQKYYVYTKHIYSPYVILMSGETFNGLTPEEQEIIMKISDEAVAYERERCSEYEAVALENIKNYPGMNYAELSPEVVEEMKAACAGIKDLAYEKVEHPEVIDLLYSEAEKAKEKYPAEQTTDAPAQTEADAAPAA